MDLWELDTSSYRCTSWTFLNHAGCRHRPYSTLAMQGAPAFRLASCRAAGTRSRGIRSGRSRLRRSADPTPHTPNPYWSRSVHIDTYWLILGHIELIEPYWAILDSEVLGQSWARVRGLGIRVRGSGIGVQGSELGYKVLELGYEVLGLGSKVLALGTEVLGLAGLGYEVSWLGCGFAPSAPKLRSLTLEV